MAFCRKERTFAILFLPQYLLIYKEILELVLMIISLGDSAGIGYGTQVIVALLNFYYIIVLAWGIFYLSFSFSWDLAWSSCNNTWNTGTLRTAETMRSSTNVVNTFKKMSLFSRRKLRGVYEKEHLNPPSYRP